MTKPKIDDLKADQNCMSDCIAAFVRLSRHHCEKNETDSVAVGNANKAKQRVLRWVATYIQDQPYL